MNKRYVEKITKKIIIPIYPCNLYIVISPPTDLMEIRNSAYFVDRFGSEPREFLGLCSRNGSNFGLFLPNYICYNVIAHEAFHLTQRILERFNVPFENEPAALLNGYIVELILEIYKEKEVTDIRSMQEIFNPGNAV